MRHTAVKPLAVLRMDVLQLLCCYLRQSVLQSLIGSSAAAVVECLAEGTGPGLNSGSMLEEMIGNALKKKCPLAEKNRKKEATFVPQKRDVVEEDGKSRHILAQWLRHRSCSDDF